MDDNQTHIRQPKITAEEPSLIQASPTEVASAEIATEVAEASTEVDISQTMVISPIDPPNISSSNNVHSSPSKELSSEHSHAMEVSKEDNEVKSVDLSSGVVTLPETVATCHETTSVELTSMPRVGSMEETEISNGRTVSGPPISLPMPDNISFSFHCKKTKEISQQVNEFMTWNDKYICTRDRNLSLTSPTRHSQAPIPIH